MQSLRYFCKRRRISLYQEFVRSLSLSERGRQRRGQPPAFFPLKSAVEFTWVAPTLPARMAHPGSDAEKPTHSFAETQWSLVLQATTSGPSGEASLAHLCKAYWFPLYTYVRRRGYPAHDAEDLTQGFFADLLRRRSLDHAEKTRGRFRTFLLTSLRNYLVNEHHKANAGKRGGGAETLPFDELAESAATALASRTDLTPDQLFDRTWALSVLEQAMKRLEDAFVAEGKGAWFRRVRPFLESGAAKDDYELIAREFGMTRNAVAVAIHRLNHRYRDTVRALVAETVADRGDAQAELEHLLATLTA